MINSQGSAYPPVSRKTPLGLPVEPEVYSLTLHSRNGTTTARQLHSDPDQAGHMYSGSVASTCSLLSRARAVERGPWFPPLPHLWNSSHRDQHPLQRQAVVQELLNMFGSALSKYVFIICSLMCVCIHTYNYVFSTAQSSDELRRLLLLQLPGHHPSPAGGSVQVLPIAENRPLIQLRPVVLWQCSSLSAPFQDTFRRSRSPMVRKGALRTFIEHCAVNTHLFGPNARETRVN